MRGEKVVMAGFSASPFLQENDTKLMKYYRRLIALTTALIEAALMLASHPAP